MSSRSCGVGKRRLHRIQRAEPAKNRPGRRAVELLVSDRIDECFEWGALAVRLPFARTDFLDQPAKDFVGATQWWANTLRGSYFNPFSHRMRLARLAESQIVSNSGWQKAIEWSQHMGGKNGNHLTIFRR